MKKLPIVIMIFLLSIVAAACGNNASEDGQAMAEEREELTIVHDLGETVVPKNPENIVVLDFGMLDTLYQLGIEATGIPKNNLPTYLSQFEDDQFVNVGGLRSLDFEAINEINPELIIISGRQAEEFEELSEIAPTVFLGVDSTNYMESFEQNVRTIGEIFGKEAEVEAELERIHEEIEALVEKVTAEEKNALVILANEGNISAFGPGSRFGMIHEVFGFIPVDENIEAARHGQSISFEYIVEKNPEYLFVVDRGAVVGDGEILAQETVENDLVRKTDAYQNGNIVYLDSNYWYLSGGGLISVQEMVNQLMAVVE